MSLITAIGVSLLLQNLRRLRRSSAQRPDVADTHPDEDGAKLSRRADATTPVAVTNIDLIVTSDCRSSLMLLLTVGRATHADGPGLRAVSFRFDTATLMGINTNRIISFTFMLGSALAAVAGVLDAIRYDVRPLMGLLPGLKAFIAAVLGGIGAFPGAASAGCYSGLSRRCVRRTCRRQSKDTPTASRSSC